MQADAKYKEMIEAATKRLKTHGVSVKGGKTYLEVKHRVEILREYYGLSLGIETTLLHWDEQRVICQAKIVDAHGRIVGMGTAEELRNTSSVNKTSALENAESSSIGRALGSLALHGGEYPSAEEMETMHRNSETISKPTEVTPPPVARIVDDIGDTLAPPADSLEQSLARVTSSSSLAAWRNANQEDLEALKKTEPHKVDVLRQQYKELETSLQKE